MKKTLIAAALAVTAAGAFAASAPVMNAQPSTPWYVGVGLDYSPVATDQILHGDFKLNNRGFGGTGFVGYHVNKYFGTEFGFDVIAANKYKGSVKATLQVKNRWNIHFVGNAYLPVCSWFSPFAFAGVAWINNQVELNSGALHVSKYSGLGLTYGAGLQFNIQEFGVRVKYTRFDASSSVNNVITSNNTAQDLVSLDVLYRFGM